MQFEQLGPYRLGKKLGRGGMGTVFAAVDTDSGETAAVKVLSPLLAAEEGFRARFEAEIESLKKLRHPNIVRLFGYGEQGGTLFYSMELVEGRSLDEQMRGGRRFEWREVTQISIQLCRALKHAHDHGIIHRDIKPANLLLTADGVVKLSDFGIARLFGNTRMTADGGVLGTAEFMASEQADGRTVTERADQYSLGAVMYTLLAGRPPFRANSFVEMLQLQRFAEPEPITRLAPATPAELGQIIHQLLDKDPQKRFANTLILSRTLEAMERGLSMMAARDEQQQLMPDEPITLSNDYLPLAATLPSAEHQPRVTAGSELEATEITEARGNRDGSADGPPRDIPSLEQPLTPPVRALAAMGAAASPSSETAERFTKVEPRRESRDDVAGETLRVLLSPQTLSLVAALLALLGLGWYLMQPPNADNLYRQIDQAASSDNHDDLVAAQSKMESFLKYYGDDPRAERVRVWQEEAKSTHPIERAFVDAQRLQTTNVEQAQAKFQAIVDMYGGDEQAGEVERRYVRRAQQQVDRLERYLAARVDDDRKVVAAQLARAEKLVASDPAQAKKIYAGVIELYGDRNWAASLVEQARQASAALGN